MFVVNKLCMSSSIKMIRVSYSKTITMSHPSEPQFVTHKLSDGSNIQLSITKHPDSSKHAVVCDLCATLIELTAGGGLWYFTQHRGSKACKNKEQRRQAAAVTREAQMALNTVVRVFLHIICYFNLSLLS